ncbi:hypothetical protein [Candidatus Tisiphia endosymbiont of Ditula angustiorana]|uniref:hypothetical protein n=1 Tax=Candidatus Tisiphia endosymbiont of Ditula angustiorana TaxID=3066272 RepID=UPI00312CB663
MKAARIKIERNQDQYQNIVSQNVVNLSKKKNKPQEVVINDTIKQTSNPYFPLCHPCEGRDLDSRLRGNNINPSRGDIPRCWDDIKSI